MKATLSVTAKADQYEYRLGAGGAGLAATADRHQVDEQVGLLCRWMTWELTQEDAETLSQIVKVDPGDERFASQAQKVNITAMGSFVSQQLLPSEIASGLVNAPIIYLSLDLDDALLGVPWELATVNGDLLCKRYATSRKTGWDKPEEDSLGLGRETKFLLIEDPTDTLPASRREISYLAGQLLRIPGVKIRRGGVQMRKRDFLNILREGGFDVLHFSGHGYFDDENPENSHLLFYDYDNPCHAYEIAENLRGTAPTLIFSNACTSAQTAGGQEGLAGAFLSSGASTYVGSIWPVGDEVAGMMGSEFYRFVIHGRTVGEALWLSRLNTFKRFGWSDPSWAAYVMYGEPTLGVSV